MKKGSTGIREAGKDAAESIGNLVHQSEAGAPVRHRHGRSELRRQDSLISARV